MVNKYLILTLLFLVSCKKKNTKYGDFPGKVAEVVSENLINRKKQIPTIIEVDLSKTIKGNYDDYFSLKKIIYLDNKSPIGGITVIRQYDNKIFILDANNTKQIFCYDLDGKLIWESNSKGVGPLEYRKISDFVINTKKQTIDILDNKTYKIISLNINTGVAESEFKLGFYGKQMVNYDNETYLLYNQNIIVSDNLKYKLLLVDQKLHIKSRNLFIEVYEEDKHETGLRNLEKSNGTIYFTESLNDTIYTIKNDTLKSSYYIDFKENKYPDNLKFNFDYDKAAKLEKEHPFVSKIDQVREKKGFLSFTFIYNNKMFAVFYNIRNKKTYIFNKLENGKTLNDNIFYSGFINDGFIEVVEPYNYLKFKEDLELKPELKKNLRKYNKEIYEVIMNINSNSNPILFVYEFKKIN